MRPFLLVVLLSGCGKDACERSQERRWGDFRGDDVYYDYVDSGVWYWDSGWTREPYVQPTTLEIGVGVREFIDVVPTEPVVPEYAADGSRNVRVALRTSNNVARSGLEVALEAFVGSERVAANSYVGVRLQCRDRALIAGNLRLDLDPAQLPPPPAAVQVPVDEPFDDVWWGSADTGLWRQQVDRSDVVVKATLHDPVNDVSVQSESRWYVPR